MRASLLLCGAAVALAASPKLMFKTATGQACEMRFDGSRIHLDGCSAGQGFAQVPASLEKSISGIAKIICPDQLKKETANAMLDMESGLETTVDGFCRFTCQQGFYWDGNDCQSCRTSCPTGDKLTGTCSHKSNPTCVRDEHFCPATFAFKHGAVTINSRHYQATASAKCDSGYDAAPKQATFNNPTINIRDVEQKLGAQGSGNPDPNSLPTNPYLLCAGQHGPDHTNEDHMALRFCQLNGYTGVSSIETHNQGGTCAVFHRSGSGRRIDGSHGTKIRKIVCSGGHVDPPVLTCMDDGTWEADKTCCNDGNLVFNDPTINIRAVEEKLGGSGNPDPNSFPTHSFLLCAGDHGSGHTDERHMADRFCKFHGYPKGHASLKTDSRSGTCAVYHNSGSGRRIDGSHGTKIAQITCLGQCS